MSDRFRGGVEPSGAMNGGSTRETALRHRPVSTWIQALTIIDEINCLSTAPLRTKILQHLDGLPAGVPATPTTPLT
ncbi:hypothetical protein [Streptomyces sp. NPDC005423]|uniref:hypothetical protein n=1 Tax=Streptomyces sp. NPDC005423 TaxID=3155343 RepID=UPI0033BDA2C2